MRVQPLLSACVITASDTTVSIYAAQKLLRAVACLSLLLMLLIKRVKPGAAQSGILFKTKMCCEQASLVLKEKLVAKCDACCQVVSSDALCVLASPSCKKMGTEGFI